MIVEGLIKRKPIIIQMGAPLSEAIRLMVSERVGSVVIVKEGRPVGIITERDVLKAIVRGLKLTTPVEKVGTTRNLITITADSRLSEVAAKMRDHGIRHLIVLGRDGSLKGVISARDLLYEKEFIELLAESNI